MSALADRVAGLVAAIAASGFRGDVAADSASRAAASTDNSVYQLMPDLIVAPRDADDVMTLFRVLDQPAFRDIPITGRGGGTGTNGQSLNTGVIVDFRRHMHRILEVNVEEGWVEVEPGLVLDDLNEQLQPTGLFFAPSTSTANRCTVGGMASTDASGKGSRIYGKTGDNVLGMQLVVGDGKVLDSSRPVPDWAAPMLAEVAAACDAGRDALLARVSRLARRFSGLDLERARPDLATLEWWRLSIGAEGVLGVITRLRLKLVRKPVRSSLAILAFSSFAEVLGATTRLLEIEPLAIEAIDEWVQRLAAEAGLLDALPAVLRGSGRDRPVYAFVEFVGDDADLLAEQARHAVSIAETLPGYVGSYVAETADEIAQLWSVRSASVGLLGAARSARRPISFVEDCVIPPDSLASFISDFIGILDRHGLSYGIYGHADVGCLHVRPALDIDDVADRQIYRFVSDAVFATATAHGGIFWGEHGKGIRGEYLESFVGPVAYRAFQRIKAAFDPWGRFNPGKLIASALPLYGIDATPHRTARAALGDPFEKAFACNGNALCLTYEAKTPMCPSFKVSAELRHSPKGRAEAMRALAQARTTGTDTATMEADVFDALDGCLGCKSCAGTCPTHVDIPEMKSHFLDRYYQTRQRPLASLITMALERWSPALAHVLPLASLMARMPGYDYAARQVGLVDLPKPSTGRLLAKQRSARQVAAMAPSPDDVLLVQDPFTALFDRDAVNAVTRGFQALGFKPMLLGMRSGGKAAHVMGHRADFAAQAERLSAWLGTAAKSGFPLVGIDPAFVHLLRSEYQKAGYTTLPRVWSPEEFLAAQIDAGRLVRPMEARSTAASVFLHCTERSLRPETAADWRKVFAATGVAAQVVDTGCCGMSGIFGHEQRHRSWSRGLFDLSWRDAVERPGRKFATGFSCRCQIERFGGTVAPHPMALFTTGGAGQQGWSALT